jgi:hypothetical protein
MTKKYSQKQVGKIIAKAVKNFAGKNPVQDVLDPDKKVELDEKTVPVEKPGIMLKNKTDKLKKFMEKRKKKLKQ